MTTGMSAPPMMMHPNHPHAMMPMNNMGGGYRQPPPGMMMPPPHMVQNGSTLSTAGGVLAGMGINMRRVGGGRPPPGIPLQNLPVSDEQLDNEKIVQYFELINRALSTKILSAEKHGVLALLINQRHFAQVEQEMLIAYQNSSPVASPTNYQTGPPSPTYSTMPPPPHARMNQPMHPHMRPLPQNNWGGPGNPPSNGPSNAWAQNNARVKTSAPPPGFDLSGGRPPIANRSSAAPPTGPQPPGINGGGATMQTRSFHATPGRQRSAPPVARAPVPVSPPRVKRATPAFVSASPSQQQQAPPGLPYGGSLDAAMKAQDREAIRILMKVRDEVNNRTQIAKHGSGVGGSSR